jgi:hypothetical protein
MAARALRLRALAAGGWEDICEETLKFIGLSWLWLWASLFFFFLFLSSTRLRLKQAY